MMSGIVLVHTMKSTPEAETPTPSSLRTDISCRGDVVISMIPVALNFMQPSTRTDIRNHRHLPVAAMNIPPDVIKNHATNTQTIRTDVDARVPALINNWSRHGR